MQAILLWKRALVSTAEVEYPGETISNIAFGSCHKIKDVNATDGIVWDAIRKLDPDTFIWTGDAVYPTQKGNAQVSNLKLAYDEMHQNPAYGYSTFLSSPPPLGIHGTWDDHDFGGNDRGNEMPDPIERKMAYLDFLQVPPDDIRRTRSTKGVYTSLSFGDAPQKAMVILLDTRSFRDRHCIPSVAGIKYISKLGAVIACLTRWFTAGFQLSSYFPSCQSGGMLGEEQWAWLEQELEQSDAQAHIIVSSVQMFTTNPLVESWCHFQKERKRILQLLTNRDDKKEIPGIVFLSGDVHFAEISSSHPNYGQTSTNDKTINPLLEVTSSGLTHTCTGAIYGPMCKPILNMFSDHRYRYNAAGELRRETNDDVNYFTNRNFGSIEFNWKDENDPIGTFEVKIHDQHGKVVLSTGKSFLSASTSLKGDDIDNIATCDDGHLIPLGKKLFFLVSSILIFCGLYVVKRRKSNVDTCAKKTKLL